MAKSIIRQGRIILKTEMRSFEHYQRQFNRVQEEVLRTRSEDIRLGDVMEILKDPASGRTLRAVALGKLIKKLVPGSRTPELGSMYDTQNLPFDPELLEFKGKIGMGGVSDVYLLESQDRGFPSVVLKINGLQRASASELVAKAAELQKEHEEIRSWYEDVKEIAPPEHFVVTEGVMHNEQVIMSVQEFIGSNLKDIFTEVEEDDLVQHAELDPVFYDQLSTFVQMTLKKEDEEKVSIDLLGNQNVSVAENEKGDWRLVLLDLHGIQQSGSMDKKRESMKNERLDLLRRLDQRFGRIQAEERKAS